MENQMNQPEDTPPMIVDRVRERLATQRGDYRDEDETFAAAEAEIGAAKR